jgi:TonB family protein
MERENGVTAKPIYKPHPAYTDKARKQKIQGTVVLSMVVTEVGRGRDAKVTASLDKVLDNPTLAAVRTKDSNPPLKIANLSHFA